MKGDRIYNTGRVEIGSAWQPPLQLCDAREASAFQRFDACGYGAPWWCAIALCAVLAVIVIAATA